MDILPPDAAFDDYRLILAPGLAIMSADLKARLAACKAFVIVGPRAGAKTPEGAIPVPLPPGLPGLGATVSLVESLPPGVTEAFAEGEGGFIRWSEHLEGSATVRLSTASGRPALVANGRLSYLAGWPDRKGWDQIVFLIARDAGLQAAPLPEGLRMRDTASHRFVFNYGPAPVEWNGVTIPPAGVEWWPIA